MPGSTAAPAGRRLQAASAGHARHRGGSEISTVRFRHCDEEEWATRHLRSAALRRKRHCRGPCGPTATLLLPRDWNTPSPGLDVQGSTPSERLEALRDRWTRPQRSRYVRSVPQGCCNVLHNSGVERGRVGSTDAEEQRKPRPLTPCKPPFLKNFSGGGGIRTLGGPKGPQRFSRPPRSTAPAPLRGVMMIGVGSGVCPHIWLIDSQCSGAPAGQRWFGRGRGASSPACL
jgi:hypothetical protein